MKGNLLLASSVAFKDMRKKAEKLSCIILCCTNSYLLLRTAQLVVATVLVAKSCCCACASAPQGWQKELCDCVTLGVLEQETPFSLSTVAFSCI